MKQWKKLWSVGGGIVALGTAFLAGKALADVPPTTAMTYSGVLEDVTGNVLSGDHDIGVVVYNAAVDGASVCSVAAATLTLESGRFSIPLPAACSDAVLANPELWIEATVDGVAMGRTRLGAVPYAIQATQAVSAGTAYGATVGGTLEASLQSHATSLSSLDTRLQALEGRTDLNIWKKTGNNGSVSCDTFCLGDQWGGWHGTCVAAWDGISQTYAGCDWVAGVTTGDTRCWCAVPAP